MGHSRWNPPVKNSHTTEVVNLWAAIIFLAANLLDLIYRGLPFLGGG
jgi:hypothetical protein